ncbi:pectate lyase family protein [Planctomicrobium sp. SH664]|uniref:pectate lyase family protein n=1 Tax=Planctomicrobium sp. SH664 TaxID=3448125 RepID=UPI003F5BF1E4
MPLNRFHTTLASCLLLLLWGEIARSEVPEPSISLAFPGAEGWGASTRGGRGGRVLKVTNLNSSGPGSLAEACAAAGPRIVVFEVSGVIRGLIRIPEPYLTIAGQTAPGAGITIEGMISSYDHGVHDILIRHLRIRRPRDYGSGGDCVQLAGLGPRKTGTHHILLDHLSLSWGNDEIIDLYHAHDATVQWCTIEESDDQGHNKGAHNFGLISAAEDSGAITLHHNLWAHQSRRVPCLVPYRENAAGDFCNNVIYNCRGGYSDDGHGGRARSPVALHQNYYRRGPQTLARMYPFALSPEMSYFVSGNFFEDWGEQGHPRHWRSDGQAGAAPRWIQFNNNGKEIAELPSLPPVELTTPQQAYEMVLQRAGCWPRDRVTTRTIDEVRNQSGAWGRNAPLELSTDWYLSGLTTRVPAADRDGDGIPDEWEAAHGLNADDPEDANRITPAGASVNDRHRGYPYIEFYLNELADQLVPR